MAQSCPPVHLIVIWPCANVDHLTHPAWHARHPETFALPKSRHWPSPFSGPTFKGPPLLSSSSLLLHSPAPPPSLLLRWWANAPPSSVALLCAPPSAHLLCAPPFWRNGSLFIFRQAYKCVKLQRAPLESKLRCHWSDCYIMLLCMAWRTMRWGGNLVAFTVFLCF